MKRYALLLIAAVVLGGTSCSTLSNLFSSSTSPSATTTTDSFSGSIIVGGNSFFTFTVVNPGTVNVDLTTLGVNTPVGLGIGVPNGTASCTLASTSQSTLAGGTPQLSVSETAGTFCVAVFDTGTLTSATTFSVTVSHS
jgi:hypothetical protein